MHRCALPDIPKAPFVCGLQISVVHDIGGLDSSFQGEQPRTIFEVSSFSGVVASACTQSRKIEGRDVQTCVIHMDYGKRTPVLEPW